MQILISNEIVTNHHRVSLVVVKSEHLMLFSIKGLTRREIISSEEV